jgi:Helix-turn-helix
VPRYGNECHHHPAWSVNQKPHFGANPFLGLAVQPYGCGSLPRACVPARGNGAETGRNATKRLHKRTNRRDFTIPKQIAVDEVEMARLYVDEDMTQQEVADTLGLSQQTISRYLSALGIEAHPPASIELAPIPDDVNDEDRRKLVYIRGEVIDQKHGKREQDDLDLLCGTYRDVLRRYATPQHGGGSREDLGTEQLDKTPTPGRTHTHEGRAPVSGAV